MTAVADHRVAAIDGLLPGFGRVLIGMVESWEWAEDEIEQALARHPQHADRIYHSFGLLTSTHERMQTEFVYRSHCRELLDRVADGQDTRPGTAAEVVCALMATSLLAPLRSSAVGLYMRMWQAAGFPSLGGSFAEDARHHEALEASTIDDHEQFTRRKIAVADRRLGDIDCPGRHYGDEVNCAYARKEDR